MKKNVLLLICIMTFSVNAQSTKEISRDWTSFVQSIAIKSDTIKRFKVEASVKVITTDSNAWAGVWVRVDNKNKEYGFFDNMEDRPISSDTWQTYTIEGTIDSNSETLNFGGICIFNGQFFFDDFKLFLEDGNGELQLLAINNNSFEKTIQNNTIQGWNFGISEKKIVKVKEFETSSTTDKVDGKYALLIEGNGIVFKEALKIIPVEGASPQIATLISMLDNLKDRVENQVKNMSQYELDYLHDENANRIGSLIMHLAAAEKYYQVFTFENRGFNEEEKKIWQVALDLDQGGRDEIRGHDAQYYLNIYNEVRAKTIEELKKRDDAWLAEVQEKYNMNNFFGWFHVMEHQSSHLGQILFLKKRIPPQPETNFEPINKQ